MHVTTIASFLGPRVPVRPTPWRWWTACVLLLAAVTACSDGDGEVQEDEDPATTITVEVPNLRTRSVEYSVRCLDVQSKGQTDLNREFETVAEGLLEPVGVAGDGRVPPTTVWRGLIDLQAASCFVDLEAHDDDGGLLCSASEVLKVEKNVATEKYVLLACEEPVGQAHLIIEAPETLEAAEIEAIALTATCLGNEDRVLDPTPPVVVEGIFERTGRDQVDLGAGPVPVQIWVDIVRDLPPGPCLFEFMAFDIDDQPLCESDRTLEISANAVATLYTFMVCPR